MLVSEKAKRAQQALQEQRRQRAVPLHARLVALFRDAGVPLPFANEEASRVTAEFKQSPARRLTYFLHGRPLFTLTK